MLIVRVAKICKVTVSAVFVLLDNTIHITTVKGVQMTICAKKNQNPVIKIM